MARPARLNLINLPQYVMQTGLLNQTCFYDVDDYLFYLKSLKIAAEQYRCEVHAYALLKNIVHIIVTPTMSNGVPSMMSSVGRRYVQHFNKRYKRTGSLWSRYKSSLIESNAYLLSCYQYAELRPLHYGLVLDIDAYPWSSFHHHSGRLSSDLIQDHELYISLGEDSTERCAAYNKLFRYSFDSGLLEYIDETIQVGQVLGGDRFKDKIELLIDRRVRPLKRGRPRKSVGVVDSLNRE